MSDLDDMLYETLTDAKLTPQERFQQVDLILKTNKENVAAKFPAKYCLNFNYLKFLRGEDIQASMPAMAATQNDLETVRLLMENGYVVMLEETLYKAILYGHIDIIRYLLTLDPKIDDAIAPLECTNGHETSCLSIAESNRANFEILNAYKNLKISLALSLQLPTPAVSLNESAKAAKNSTENKSDTTEIKEVEENKTNLPETKKTSYKKVLGPFVSAVELDTVFVIQYLARCLHQINIGQKTKADYPLLKKMTEKLFEILNDEDYPDDDGYNYFKDTLMPEWLAYEVAEGGYFVIKAQIKMKETERYKFLDRMFKGENPAAKFAEGKDETLTEKGGLSDAVESLENTSSLPKLSGLKSTLHAKPAAKEEKLEAKSKDYYFERYLKLTSSEKSNLLKEHKDFDAYAIVHSVVMLAHLFGINDFRFCVSYTGSSKNDADFPSDLTDFLKNGNTRYIPIVGQTREGTHAVAGVVDKLQRQIFAVDPEGNRRKSETEWVNHLQVQKQTIDDLKNYEIIQSKKLGRYAITGNIPQDQNDEYNCGFYTAMIILAILLKQEKIPLKSDNPAVQKVLDSLDIDVAAGKLPRSEFLDTYKGVLILARKDYDPSHNNKLCKNLILGEKNAFQLR